MNEVLVPFVRCSFVQYRRDRALHEDGHNSPLSAGRSLQQNISKIFILKSFPNEEELTVSV